MSRRSSALLLQLLLLFAGGCGARSPGTTRPLGGLLVVCEPAEAEIYVDDRFLGTVAAQRGRPLMLAPGPRRIELRHRGYFAHYAEVELVRGVRQRIEVRLRKRPF
jgi:hypothetical protein